MSHHNGDRNVHHDLGRDGATSFTWGEHICKRAQNKTLNAPSALMRRKRVIIFFVYFCLRVII
jgi:hypothetical protein